MKDIEYVESVEKTVFLRTYSRIRRLLKLSRTTKKAVKACRNFTLELHKKNLITFVFMTKKWTATKVLHLKNLTIFA